MPAPISVVIPTWNAAADLPETLAALMPGLTAGMIREVVVTDGGSTDGTRRIAEAAGAVWVEGPPGRGGQLMRGVAAAQAPWIFVLHADTHLAGPWARSFTAHIVQYPEGAGYFALRFRATGAWPWWVARWANFRSQAFGLPYGDQGLLLSRALYDQVGGYPDIPLMEDVARVRQLRGRLRRLEGWAETSAGRYEADGWARRGARNLWTLLRYLAGADPEALARAYTRRRT